MRLVHAVVCSNSPWGVLCFVCIGFVAVTSTVEVFRAMEPPARTLTHVGLCDISVVVHNVFLRQPCRLCRPTVLSTLSGMTIIGYSGVMWKRLESVALWCSVTPRLGIAIVCFCFVLAMCLFTSAISHDLTQDSNLAFPLPLPRFCAPPCTGRSGCTMDCAGHFWMQR